MVTEHRTVIVTLGHHPNPSARTVALLPRPHPHQPTTRSWKFHLLSTLLIHSWLTLWKASLPNKWNCFPAGLSAPSLSPLIRPCSTARIIFLSTDQVKWLGLGKILGPHLTLTWPTRPWAVSSVSPSLTVTTTSLILCSGVPEQLLDSAGPYTFSLLDLNVFPSPLANCYSPLGYKFFQVQCFSWYKSTHYSTG